jgi:RNA polymerase sigma-54 factor
MEIGPQLLPRLQLKVTPKQIAANYILQLSSMELQELINEELQENPALEQTETAVCPLCGNAINGPVCLTCFGPSASGTRTYDADFEPLEGSSLMLRDEEDDELNPIVRAEAEQTLAEYLLWNLRASLPRNLYAIAEYLVGNLDDSGYLRMSVDEIARTIDADRRDVERALAALQSVEPVGIGARDTRECLLLQLDHLAEEEALTHPHARAIVAEHFKELGERKFGEIASSLRISREDVQDALDFIKDNLNPYPAHGFALGPEGAVGSHESALRPDVIIRKNELGDYDVEVIESRRYTLRVSPLYRDLVGKMQALRGTANGESLQLGDKDRQHVREYVTRAKFFIDNINQRRRTIKRITETIVECQREFLDSGIQHLRPLTRAEVGERIGMHESTVSRATAGKYVMLPNREVVPFSMFFTASLGVKDVIKNLIDGEEPRRPLSDREIVEKLRDEGIILARRTVAKYRDEMKILPARLRRRA